MSVDRIDIRPRDAAGARRVAADSLQTAVRFEGVLAYRAAWAGSAAALGALGLHRDAEVTPRDLAAVLQGHSARDGAPMRQPGIVDLQQMVVSTGVTLEAPAELTAAWREAGPEGQAEIERALIASSATALEDVRQASTLIAGGPVQLLPAFATGLAAAVIVHAPPDHGPNDDRPLRVRVLLVGAELSTGRLVPPSAQLVRAAEPALAAAMRKALANEAARSLEAAAAAPHGRLVGRDDAWVRDPLDEYPLRVGERYSRQIGDLATLYGEEFAQRSDAWLRERATEVGSPLAMLDSELVRVTIEADRAVEHAGLLALAAEEDLIMLEARAAEPDAARQLGAAVKVQRDRAQSLRRAAEQLAADVELLPGEGRYIHDVMAERLQPAAEQLAILREQAIREAELTLGDRGTPEPVNGSAAGREPPPNATQIGRGEVSALLDELRADLHRGRERRHEPGAALRVGRGDVHVRKALHSLRDAIGVERADRLAERVAQLTNQLARLPDELVSARHAELGQPNRFIDRRGARATLRIEGLQQAGEHRLDEAESEVAALESQLERSVVAGATRDETKELVELLELAKRAVTDREETLDLLDSDERRLHREGGHLDGQLARYEDQLVRALAYADEHALRRAMDIRQRVERAVVDPPDAIVELIGPVPRQRQGRERERWESIVRDVEYSRLEGEADGRDGIAPMVRGPLAERDFNRRIDELRADRGMPPLPGAPDYEASVDPPAIEF